VLDFFAEEPYVTFLAFVLSTLAATLGFIINERLEASKERQESKIRYSNLLKTIHAEINFYNNMMHGAVHEIDQRVKRWEANQDKTRRLDLPTYGISTLLLEEARSELARSGLNTDIVITVGRCISSLIAINTEFTKFYDQTSLEKTGHHYQEPLKTIQSHIEHRLLPNLKAALAQLGKEIGKDPKTTP
jgi:hypothetical protein